MNRKNKQKNINEKLYINIYYIYSFNLPEYFLFNPIALFTSLPIQTHSFSGINTQKSLIIQSIILLQFKQLT